MTQAPLSDPAYLRAVQYADEGNLDARARLHRRYGRGDWADWVAARLPWADGLRVLEVGCGPGWLWEAAGRRTPRAALDLTLTDLSPGMVEAALGRARAAAWIAAGRQADACALPFAEASFDVVVSCHMLYHLPDPAAGVAEIARVLAPGGMALVATNGAQHMAELVALEATIWPGRGDGGVADRFGLENGGAMLDVAFEAVSLERYEDDLVVSDPADVIAYIASSPPASEGSAAERAALEAAVGAAFAAGGGAMRIGKDAGLFTCRRPRLSKA